MDTLLDIGEETALLAETKDIRDELNMISMVLKHQLSVLDDLANALLEELRGNHNQQKQADVRKRFREQHKVVEVHLKDVERMDKQAEGIYTSVRTSLLRKWDISLTDTADSPTRPQTEARQCIRGPLCQRSSRFHWSTGVYSWGRSNPAL